MKLKLGFPRINYDGEGAGGGAAAAAIAGGTPAATGGFAWPADLDTGIADTLRSKGFYDDPVKGAVGLAKSYHELNRMHSGAADVVAIPKADAKPEAWDAFYAKLGRPETADKYDVKPNPNLIKMQDGDIGFAKKLAHLWGVPASKINEGVHAWQQYQADASSAWTADAKAKSDAAVAQIRTEMGEEKFNTSVANAQKAFKAMRAQNLISDKTMAALEQTVGALPLIELMAAIGQKMGGEGSILAGVNAPMPTDPSQMTKEQARAEMARLQGDADFNKSYLDGRHPDHKNSVARMNALAVAAVGG